MRIYRAQFFDRDMGARLAWFSNAKDAGKHLRDQQRARIDPASGPEGVTPVDIPAGKQGLLNWLNANFTSDNG